MKYKSARKKSIFFEQISVSVDRDDLKVLRHLAVDSDMSMSQVIREAILDYLARREKQLHRATGTQSRRAIS
jgi:predicted transcriptional regulator